MNYNNVILIYYYYQLKLKMEIALNSFTISLIKKLNECSSLGYIKYICYVDENRFDILSLDELENNIDENKYFINVVKKKTIFHHFHCNTWRDLVNNVHLNFHIRKQLKTHNIPSNKMMKLIVHFFKYIFENDISETLLHVLSTTSNNYLLYCLSKWFQQTGKPNTPLLAFLNYDQYVMFNSFCDKEKIENYIYNYNQIEFPSFIKNESLILSNEPTYYKESKIYSLASTYHGMGYYITLSISVSYGNVEKPFFFRLDGGSNGYEREENEKFFKHFVPPKDKMLNLPQVLEIIENNTFEQLMIVP